MTTLYIAGPMTGLPELNYPLFNKVDVVLAANGFGVLNPADNRPPKDATEWGWQDYMKQGLTMLLKADGVALLPNWTLSKGALLEHHVADQLGMPIKNWWEWLL